MVTGLYLLNNTRAATATALLLILPQIEINSPAGITPTLTAEYQVLGTVGADVAKAVTTTEYAPMSQETLSSLLWEAASKLMTESKTLEPEFSSIVDREFWNLLQ